MVGLAAGPPDDGDIDATGPLEVPWSGPPEYHGLEVLSPMVRASCLPLRICCLQHGAGLVYSGCELDLKVLDSTRIAVPNSTHVDFYHHKTRRNFYSTCGEERGRNIFQLGTANAPQAVKAALHMCRDVRGIDVNMGCCEDFLATIGGGSALLRKPDLAADILKSLRRELPPECALSCKIRLLDTSAQTRDFMQLCERSGVNAIAVHCRQTDEKFTDAARWQELLGLCDAVSIPVIANGGFLSRGDIQAFWEQYDTVAGGDVRQPAALMIARGALMDPAIFHRSLSVAPPSRDEVMSNYIRTAARVENSFDNTKWTLKEMVNRPAENSHHNFGGLTARPWKQFKQKVDKAMTMRDMCSVFGVTDAEVPPPCLESA